MDARDSNTRRMGKRVKELREAHKMTQIDLANATGVSRPTISRIEAGHGAVDAADALSLATALKVKLRAITGSAGWSDRVATAGRPSVEDSCMEHMREAAIDYLETYRRVAHTA